VVRKKYKFVVFSWNEKIYKVICMIAMFTMKLVMWIFMNFNFMALGDYPIIWRGSRG